MDEYMNEWMNKEQTNKWMNKLMNELMNFEWTNHKINYLKNTACNSILLGVQFSVFTFLLVTTSNSYSHRPTTTMYTVVIPTKLHAS